MLKNIQRGRKSILYRKILNGFAVLFESLRYKIDQAGFLFIGSTISHKHFDNYSAN